MDEDEHPELKPPELVLHLMKKYDRLDVVLDKVSQIMEQRNIQAVVEKVKKDGCIHAVDKYIAEVDPVSPEEFKKKVLPLISSSYCSWRCHLPRCLRL
jgi:hypothetical protein